MNDRRFVLMIGNPVDGVRIVGPFEDSETALEYAEARARNEDWWLVDLYGPDA